MYFALLTMQIFATFYLTGLIWTVQRAHYPSFLWVNRDTFIDFEKWHIKMITPIVAPVMLIEFICSIGLVLSTAKVFFILHLINFFLVICVWLLTFLVSVPCHAKLEKSHDLLTVKRLIKTNWYRTFTWSLLSLNTIYLLYQILKGKYEGTN